MEPTPAPAASAIESPKPCLGLISATVAIGIVINIGIGTLVHYFKIPLYLGSIGSIAVTLLLGIPCGVATAVLGAMVSGFLVDSIQFYFLGTHILIPVAVGLMARRGLFKSIPKAILAGIILGVVAGVVSYRRPFTENQGIGGLACEYPKYPDFENADMNRRHDRMIDLRNTLYGHSSIKGTTVFLLAPGALSPATGEMAVGNGHAVAKLSFDHPVFVPWLHEVVTALKCRLEADIIEAKQTIVAKYLGAKECRKLDSGAPPFK